MTKRVSRLESPRERGSATASPLGTNPAEVRFRADSRTISSKFHVSGFTLALTWNMKPFGLSLRAKPGTWNLPTSLLRRLTVTRAPGRSRRFCRPAVARVKRAVVYGQTGWYRGAVATSSLRWSCHRFCLPVGRRFTRIDADSIFHKLKSACAVRVHPRPHLTPAEGENDATTTA